MLKMFSHKSFELRGLLKKQNRFIKKTAAILRETEYGIPDQVVVRRLEIGAGLQGLDVGATMWFIWSNEVLYWAQVRHFGCVDRVCL